MRGTGHGKDNFRLTKHTIKYIEKIYKKNVGDMCVMVIVIARKYSGSMEEENLHT